jgi:hypothetical protein
MRLGSVQEQLPTRILPFTVASLLLPTLVLVVGPAREYTQTARMQSAPGSVQTTKLLRRRSP